MVLGERVIADTSVLIAEELGRPLRERLPDADVAISVVTLGELRAGFLVAPAGSSELAARLDTFERARRLAPLPIDATVAEQWANLRAFLREAERRMGVNDSWIAATALANGLPLYTQDADYDVAAEVAGLEVIRV